MRKKNKFYLTSNIIKTPSAITDANNRNCVSYMIPEMKIALAII